MKNRSETPELVLQLISTGIKYISQQELNESNLSKKYLNFIDIFKKSGTLPVPHSYQSLGMWLTAGVQGDRPVIQTCDTILFRCSGVLQGCTQQFTGNHVLLGIKTGVGHIEGKFLTPALFLQLNVIMVNCRDKNG